MTVTARRSTRALRWAVACSLVAAACTDGDDAAVEPVTSSTIPAAQTLLRVGVEDWPQCLNPLTCDSPALRDHILRHILPVAFEVDASDEYVPSPVLAGEPTVEETPDGMTVTYRLERDARWNDGRPITSTDLRATWQAVLATPGADRSGYDQITTVDDRDPHVAIVSFATPYARWRELFGAGRGWIMQADHLGAELDLTGRFREELPFSSAGYRLAAWDENGAVLAVADDHWASGRLPEVDQVRLAKVTIDELEDPRAFDVLVPAGRGVAAPDGFDVRRNPTTSVLGIWFDQREPLLAAVEHRRALAVALDRAALADVAVAEPPDDLLACLGWLPDAGPWCDEASAELPEHDPGLARFALASLGWQPSPFGTLTRGDELFAMPVTYDPAVPGALAVVEAIRESLTDVGVVVEPLPMAATTWSGSRPGAPSTGVGVFPIDLGIGPYVAGLYGCLEGPASSPMAWCPEGVVEAARALERTIDRAEQLALVGSIGRSAADATVWLPLAQQSERFFVRSSRVSLPDEVPAGHGALAGLRRFQMDR